jgi:Na+-translocating ferredoxin:NAD+ oxidoreductase subunit D
MPQMSPFIHRSPGKQQMIWLTLLAALLPVILFSHHYQHSALFRIAGYMLLGLLFDTALSRRWKPKSASGALTALLMTAGLPPAISFWPVTLALLFTLAVTKHSPLKRWIRLNAAMTGRLFLMLLFNAHTVDYGAGMDGLTTATPLELFKAESEMIPLGQLLFGRIEGDWEGLYTLIPGSPGEIYPLLTLFLGLLLCLGRIAAWRTPLAFLLAFGITTTQLNQPLLYSLFSGAICFSAAFILTDPFSTPLTPSGQLISGALIGFLTALWRRYSIYTETVVFAVLAVNLIAPLLDFIAFHLRGYRRTKRRPAPMRPTASPP